MKLPQRAVAGGAFAFAIPLVFAFLATGLVLMPIKCIGAAREISQEVITVDRTEIVIHVQDNGFMQSLGPNGPFIWIDTGTSVSHVYLAHTADETFDCDSEEIHRQLTPGQWRVTLRGAKDSMWTGRRTIEAAERVGQ